MNVDGGVPRGTSQTSDERLRQDDLSDWLTKRQAADAIGVSTKAIERFAQARKLEQRSRPQERGPNVVVYHPGDVARVASERHPVAPPFVLPAIPESSVPGNGHRGTDALIVAGANAVGGRDADPLRAFAESLVQAVMSQTSQTLPAPEPPLYVDLREASAITGLSQAYLRRLLDEEKLPARRDRGWRIRRRDLEEL